jgi:penicillin-binding protein 1C
VISRLRRALAAAIVIIGLLALATIASAWRRSALHQPAPTVQLRDRHGEFLGEVAPGEALGFWPLAEVPPRVAAATLALEDRRFAHHPGVDPVAVARALRQNLRAGQRVSGASTLAMQVARMQSPGRRTWPRKALEALTALMLVDRHGRDAVLRQYLTLAPYGNNVHGIAYAARRYFDKPVADLSWAETALLCAVPQAPGGSDLYDPAGRARAVARAERILTWLSLQGELDDVAFGAAVRELRASRPLPRPVRPASTLHAVLALAPALAQGSGGGLVETSLDLELQGRVQGILREAVAGWEGRGAGNAAAVVVALDTMQVLADVGSVGYHDDAPGGAIDFTRTPRYPGSTLKPLLYGLALDRGAIDPGTVLDDLGRGPDGIGNADGRFLGPMLPRRALANSRNVPAVALARDVGLDELYALFARLDLHDDQLPASHYGLGVAIGGMPTTPLQLATAWGAVATDGRMRPLQWTAGAERPAGVRVLQGDTVQWLALALSDPMARLPVFPRMGHGELPFPAAFKTGTSPDHRDAWAVAFTDTYLVVVWVGHPDWRPMDGLSGYRAGSRLAREILLELHPDRAQGLRDVSFPPPVGWSAVQVCPLSGRIAEASCDGAFREWFPPGRAPVAACDVHRVEGGRVVVGLPARYAAWQRAAGLPTPSGGAPSGTGQPEVRLEVVSPVAGAEVSPDPDGPPAWSTLRLLVSVAPAVDQIVWYVDGEPFTVVGPPYEARWPVQPGLHTFEAGVPFRPERSAPVTVTVF